MAPRRNGSIEKRGERVYRIRWYLGEDPRTHQRRYASKTIRGSQRDAARALREIQGRQDRGLPVPSPSRIPRLREYVETWERTGAAALRVRTRRDYVARLEREVLPSLGELRLDAIHTHHIETHVVARMRRRGHLRAAKLAVAALSRVFRTALKDPTFGLVGNPCAGVEVESKPPQRIPPLSAEERERFLEAIRGSDHETLWLMMMLTGLAPHEAFALGWEHLDLEGGVLRVERTLDCKARQLVADTKRPSRRRSVPLPPELRAALRERWLAVGRPQTGLVFTDAAGHPLDLDNLRARHFRPALKRAGIERRVKIYGLRHGFGTAGREAGMDPRTVMELMGHSSTRTTMDVYYHVSDEEKRDAIEKIAGGLGSSAPAAG